MATLGIKLCKEVGCKLSLSPCVHSSYLYNSVLYPDITWVSGLGRVSCVLKTADGHKLTMEKSKF